MHIAHLNWLFNRHSLSVVVFIFSVSLPSQFTVDGARFHLCFLDFMRSLWSFWYARHFVHPHTHYILRIASPWYYATSRCFVKKWKDSLCAEEKRQICHERYFFPQENGLSRLCRNETASVYSTFIIFPFRHRKNIHVICLGPTFRQTYPNQTYIHVVSIARRWKK